MSCMWRAASDLDEKGAFELAEMAEKEMECLKNAHLLRH